MSCADGDCGLVSDGALRSHVDLGGTCKAACAGGASALLLLPFNSGLRGRSESRAALSMACRHPHQRRRKALGVDFGLHDACLKEVPHANDYLQLRGLIIALSQCRVQRLHLRLHLLQVLLQLLLRAAHSQEILCLYRTR